MSGRRRVIPLDEVAARRPWVLRVDPSQVTSEQVEVQAPCGPHEDLRAKTFAFSFVRQSLPVLEVLRGPEGLEAGARVPFVSLDVQRALRWQTEVARSGARRILWYDENPAFEEPLEGEALLVLTGYDPLLEAYRAPLANGLLPPRYLDQVLREDEEPIDPPRPKPPPPKAGTG